MTEQELKFHSKTGRALFLVTTQEVATDVKSSIDALVAEVKRLQKLNAELSWKISDIESGMYE